MRHLRGAAKMVELNGGSIDHYLGHLLHELLIDKSLAQRGDRQALGGGIVQEEAAGAGAVEEEGEEEEEENDRN